ncbi:tyrosine-type recombinase/integrase [Mesorhizobium sp. ES1-4]|uniref:tyrosine-type recombinase/integrase n=1 Tax=Mesorhizobium sp. ES1-4 TaxID=2876627 RepID=UPI001CCA0C0F|nr:integrase arm-type DNA-binding domain-containing protein [Mesorhizobium sp. ES1-4]MBZ9794280.1 integrase arm-type DNA-binding domain-containing protein [Mesorhizobium sp. ES1-4]
MLTDFAARKAEKREKAYKLYDSGGLHLVVAASGGKLWRMKYQFGSKEKLLSFGPYPEVTLAAAREARDEARAQLRAGKDPSVAKKIRKLEAVSGDGTFETIAREWYALNKEQWVVRHATDVIESLEAEVFPTLGGAPIKDISAADVLACLRPIEKRGAKETARRIRQRMSAVFVYAVASGRAENDPAAMVKKAMAPMKKGKQPAVIDLGKAREMLVNAECETAHPVTKLALRILALTAVRPGTLATTPWAEWPAGGDLWQVPAERMKLRLQHKDDEARDHLVPLSSQTIEAIDALRTISGRGPLAFPNTRHAHKPMSENAIGYLLNRAGYHSKHVPHGWRATFSSVMNERFPSDRHIIDLMLAHIAKDKTEGAYNRALHIGRRRELAQIWADLLLERAQPASALLVGPRR